MPAIAPLSEFTRNQNAMIARLEETREPIYLTRNGSACVVVINAEAYDERMALSDELLERELRLRASIERGAEQIANGESMDANEADAMIRTARGWVQ